VIVTVDGSAATPPYEQIRVQVRDAVAEGALAAGAKLPTVRELETDGIIETRGRAGSFVAPHGDAGQQQAQVAAREFVERARRLGLDDESALDLVRAAQRG
jgi:DNA-binding transcriptional regulator YhcF (GntR family)